MSGMSDRTHSVVSGALRAAINDHGPIDADLITSATKRIVAQLRAAAEHSVILGCEGDAATRSAIEAGKKRYQKLRYAYDKLERRNAELGRRLLALSSDDGTAARCNHQEAS